MGLPKDFWPYLALRPSGNTAGRETEVVSAILTPLAASSPTRGADMKIRSGPRAWVRAAMVMTGAVVIAAGVIVAVPSLAGATVAPGLSASSSAGSVGSVVTVTFSSPAGDGCGAVAFGPAKAGAAGTVLPYDGNSGTQRFVIPGVLGSPNAPPGALVTPGAYMFSLACNTTNSAGSENTVSVPFTVTTPLPSRFVGLAPTKDGNGYWLAQAGGGVFSYGDAHFYGSLPGEKIVPAAPIVGIAATPDGNGYWLVGADGGVFGFGDAKFYGSLPGEHVVPNAPYLALRSDTIVGITADPAGGGYWLIGEDGGVFGFGAAAFLGSAPQPATLAAGLTDEPFVGLGATTDGGGYYEAGITGAALGFGDVTSTQMSIGNVTLASLVTGVAVTSTGGGAWFVGSDGGVFAVKATGGTQPPFLGSLPGEGIRPAAPIVGIAATHDDLGYWLVGADGGVFSFGDARFYGSAGGSGLPW